MNTQEAVTRPDVASTGSEQWMEVLQRQVGSLKFGVVQITVHNSKVVQVEKTEKIRFQEPKEASGSGRRDQD
jgi:hypothetical protein